MSLARRDIYLSAHVAAVAQGRVARISRDSAELVSLAAGSEQVASAGSQRFRRAKIVNAAEPTSTR